MCIPCGDDVCLGIVHGEYIERGLAVSSLCFCSVLAEACAVAVSMSFEPDFIVAYSLRLDESGPDLL